MSTSITAQSTSAARSSFWSSRLGSLLAVAPLGVWTFCHLWNNLAAFQGDAAWQSSVTEYPHPLAQMATGIMVLLPLLWHAIWGIGRIFSSRPNNQRYGYYANFKYILQRITAVGVLLFLGAHLWLALIHPRLVEGHAETFANIAHEMHFHTPTLLVYILGVAGVAYHLANGLHSAAMGWGLVVTRKALGRLEGVALILLFVLLLMGWGSVFALWRAGASY